MDSGGILYERRGGATVEDRAVQFQGADRFLGFLDRGAGWALMPGDFFQDRNIAGKRRKAG